MHFTYWLAKCHDLWILSLVFAPGRHAHLDILYATMLRTNASLPKFESFIHTRQRSKDGGRRTAFRCCAGIELRRDATHLSNTRQATVEDVSDEYAEYLSGDRSSTSAGSTARAPERRLIVGYGSSFNNADFRKSKSTISASDGFADESLAILEGCSDIPLETAIAQRDVSLHMTSEVKPGSIESLPSRDTPAALHLPREHCTGHTNRATCVSAGQNGPPDTNYTIDSETATSNCCSEKSQCVQTLRKETTADERDLFSKRQRPSDPSAHIRDDDWKIASVDTATSIPSGHCYRNMRVGGHSRVHMGDNHGGQTFIIHNHLDPLTAMDFQDDVAFVPSSLAQDWVKLDWRTISDGYPLPVRTLGAAVDHLSGIFSSPFDWKIPVSASGSDSMSAQTLDTLPSPEALALLQECRAPGRSDTQWPPEFACVESHCDRTFATRADLR
jgi:hypothetical protein